LFYVGVPIGNRKTEAAKPSSVFGRRGCGGVRCGSFGTISLLSLFLDVQPRKYQI
jgi:hypothetical protein